MGFELVEPGRDKGNGLLKQGVYGGVTENFNWSEQRSVLDVEKALEVDSALLLT